MQITSLRIEAHEPPTPVPGIGTVPEETPAPALDFISSDETLDRYDEIISPTGWRLEAYRRNPVFQNAHQYGDVLFTLGKALLTEVRQIGGRPALFQRIAFATDVNPMARIAYGLYRGHFLNAVSVGFLPIRWEDGAPGSAFRRKHLEQELLEVSAVSIPANPNALLLARGAGAIEQADLRELLELIRAGLDAHPAPGRSNLPPTPADSAADTRALGGGVNEAQRLWQLAREIRKVLRNS